MQLQNIPKEYDISKNALWNLFLTYAQPLKE